MLSTLSSYRLYAGNLQQSLDRVASQSVNARNAAYYEATIGKIGSVDAFLDDYRLYSYALKAYGLEDQINAKGLMRKVLESDLTDAGSFANKLVDPRYRAFAAAFDFNTAGKEPAAQSTAQTERLIEAYGERVSRTALVAAQKTRAFESGLTTILEGSATAAEAREAILADRAIVDVALRAAGVADPSLVSTDTVRAAIDGTATGLSAPLAKLRGYTDALLAANGAAARARVVSNIVYDYNNATGNGTSPQAAQADIDYLKALLDRTPPIANTTDLTSDERVVKVMQAAVGLTTSYTADYINGVLRNQSVVDNFPVRSSSGEIIPSQADTKAKLQALRDIFSFNADGTVKPTTTTAPDGTSVPFNGPMPPDRAKRFYDGYLANYRTAQQRADANAGSAFAAAMETIRSASDLLLADRDPTTGLTYDPVTGAAFTRHTTLTYALKAFDIDLATTSLSKIRAVLTSDPSDPDSYVAKLKDERFSQLAAAFNFAEDGSLRAERLVQSIQDQTKTATLYAASFGANPSAATRDIMRADTKRFLEGMAGAYSLDGFLADRRSVDFALKAYGVKDATLSTAELRRILTSDLADAGSVANRNVDPAIARFAAAFNFQPDGSVSGTAGGVQGGAALRQTDRLYLLQTLEEQAGETSEGTRLALYFLRKGPDATTSLAILSDKALFEVVRTALALPPGMSSMDVAAQQRVIEDRLDPADFADPAKLDRFIARFAAMYDINASQSVSSPILALFNGGASSGGILSLL